MHKEHDIAYVWGFDMEERKRADRLLESMPGFRHEFPLLEMSLSKADVHGVFERLFNFPSQKLYGMGYKNNNCIGCVKGVKDTGIKLGLISQKRLNAWRS